MKTKISWSILAISLFLSGCGIIRMNLSSKPSDDCNEKHNQCDKCKIQPKSGSNRDLRYGYYYDIKEKKCKAISFSTGAGCIPPPFETMEECRACCCN